MCIIMPPIPRPICPLTKCRDRIGGSVVVGIQRSSAARIPRRSREFEDVQVWFDIASRHLQSVGRRTGTGPLFTGGVRVPFAKDSTFYTSSLHTCRTAPLTTLNHPCLRAPLAKLIFSFMSTTLDP